jgi:hypothetical protein
MSVRAHRIKFAERLTDRDLSSLLKKAQVPDRKRPLAPTGVAARVPRFWEDGRQNRRLAGFPRLPCRRTHLQNCQPENRGIGSKCVTAAASKPASSITHATRAAIPSARRMHANAGSRHGNGIYSRPTTLHSQPNHTRRMSHTISTITIIVPTTPKPNIAPPSGHIGHQGYPCRHDRPGFRLSSDQNQTITRIIEMGSVRSPTCCAWITGYPEVTLNWG